MISNHINSLSKCNFQDDQDASDVKQSFIVDDDEDESPREVDEGPRDDAVNEEQDDDSDLYDSVCAICDNGGKILWYAVLFFFSLKFLLMLI